MPRGETEQTRGQQNRSQSARASQSQTSGKSRRGFASMDAERQREIAAEGGRAVPNEKRSFSQNRQLAAEAGRKGGQASHANRDGGQTRGEGRGETRGETRGRH